MQTIEIDEEVFTYLQSKAIPYKEINPNMTLRRLFHLNATSPSEGGEKSKATNTAGKKRKPRTHLNTLVQASLLREGQTLFLHDYQNNKVDGYEATISGDRLLWNKKPYSMSKLAEIGLKEIGFTSNAVRGPSHWLTSDGISIEEIWNRFLSGR